MPQTEVTTVETPEQKSQRLQDEEKFQIGTKFCTIHADDYNACEFNALALESALVADGLDFDLPSLEIVFKKLTREGRLLPPPYKEPVEEPKPFDTKGLTFEKIRRMPSKEYREKLQSPVWKPIIEFVLDQQSRGGK
jgi:hypothetical protein